jgi:hypothetical protein
MLNENKISIDDTNYHDEDNNVIEILNPRTNQKQALLNLENLLDQLPIKYGDLNGSDPRKGPDINLVDSSIDLGNPPPMSSGI